MRALMANTPMAVCTVLALGLCLLAQQAGASKGRTFHFAFIADANSPALSGAEQGIIEANLQGQFLGIQYVLEKFSSAAWDSARPDKYMAILADLPAEKLVALSRSNPIRAIFNLTAKDDQLRTICTPNLLHTIASMNMYRDAKQQWLTKQPVVEITVSGWHQDFVKFAARDLNKRYRKTFSQPMDELAWSGWAAVKMTTDLIARHVDAPPSALLRLLKTELAFDGQKGITLDFRPNGQLRQPLLIADSNGRLLGEAPVRGVVDANDLDSLGYAAEQADCP